MPFPNEHSARLQPPGKFDKDAYRRAKGGKLYGKITVPSTISIIWGKYKGKSAPSDPPIPQSLRFDKSKWTTAQMRKWLSDNKVKTTKIEPAKQTTKKSAEETIKDLIVTWDSEILDNFAALVEERREQLAGEEHEIMDFVGDTEAAESESDEYAAMTPQEKIEEGMALTVKDINKLSDAELGNYLKKRIKNSMDNKLISLEIYKDGEESDTTETDNETETVETDIETTEAIEDETTQDTETYDDTFSLKDRPVFKAGTYNGNTYTESDLDQMVKNFAILYDVVKPVLKLGHGNQEILKQAGMPAAGWATGLRRKGEMLLADFADIPKRVYDLLVKKAFKRFSAEIFPDYHGEDGKKYGIVFKAAAVLGADLPAIKTLPDIEALYNQASQTENESEVIIMSFEDSKEEIKDETTETETEEATTEETKTENEATETATQVGDPKVDKFEVLTNELAAARAEQKKTADQFASSLKAIETLQTTMADRATAQREETEQAFLTGLKKEGKFLPANDPIATRLFASLTGLEVQKYQEVDESGNVTEIEISPYDQFKAMLANGPVLVDYEERSVQGKGEEGKSIGFKEHESDEAYAETDLAYAVEKYAEEHPDVSYEEALLTVSSQMESK